MKLIIGLGNPWKEYRYNRHNVGQLFIDSLKSEPRGIKLLKNDTFMNEAGRFVSKAIRRYKVPAKDLYIVHDDLDLRLGNFKIQFAVGPKLHYGIKSIEEVLGREDFWRVRIGVDNRDPDNRMPGEEYVLQNFTTEELQVLDNLFPKIWEDMQKINLCKA